MTPIRQERQSDATVSHEALIEQLRSEIALLREQIQEKDQQIERQQLITVQLSRDIESQQKLLEMAKKPWWRRWFEKSEKDS